MIARMSNNWDAMDARVWGKLQEYVARWRKHILLRSVVVDVADFPMQRISGSSSSL